MIAREFQAKHAGAGITAEQLAAFALPMEPPEYQFDSDDCDY